MMVLTNKRLYQVGKVYEKVSDNKLVSTEGKKVISIPDITGTSFRQFNLTSSLIFGMLFLIFSIMAFFFYATDAVTYWILIISIWCLIMGLGSMIKYHLGHKRFFIVEYPGGSVATECNWYAEKELDEFQKNISIEKDRITKK
jgi:hypothetical protein